MSPDERRAHEETLKRLDRIGEALEVLVAITVAGLELDLREEEDTLYAWARDNTDSAEGKRNA